MSAREICGATWTWGDLWLLCELMPGHRGPHNCTLNGTSYGFGAYASPHDVVNAEDFMDAMEPTS